MEKILTESAKEKVVLLAIGTLASTIIAVVTFLLLAYVGSFVTFADYNKDKLADREVVTTIKTDLSYIKEAVIELKGEMKEINRELKKANK